MSTFWRALIGALAIGAVVSLVILMGGSRPIGSENLIGLPLPDFAAPLVSGTQDADANIYTPAQAKALRSTPACSVRLPGVFNSCRDLTGEAVLTFWNTTKPVCVKQIDALGAFSAKNPEVDVAGVAFDQEPETVREFARPRNWKIDLPIDRDGAVAGLYAVAGCPTTFFIRDREVTGVKLGLISADEIEKLLQTGGSSGSTGK